MAISFLPSSTIFGPSALMDSPYPPSPLVVGLSPSCSRLSSIFAFFFLPQGRAPLDGWKGIRPQEEFRSVSGPSNWGDCFRENAGPGQLSPHLLPPSPLSCGGGHCLSRILPTSKWEEGRNGLLHLLAKASLGNKLPAATASSQFPSSLPFFVHPFPFFLTSIRQYFGPKDASNRDDGVGGPFTSLLGRMRSQVQAAIICHRRGEAGRPFSH